MTTQTTTDTATIFGTKMKSEDLPYDIVFLKMRLDYVVEIEEYEKAAIIKRWIDELMVFYGIEEKYHKTSK
jgi:protein-arginine kinase activator protein McsA